VRREFSSDSLQPLSNIKKVLLPSSPCEWFEYCGFALTRSFPESGICKAPCQAWINWCGGASNMPFGPPKSCCLGLSPLVDLKEGEGVNGWKVDCRPRYPFLAVSF
jgi:hypothetical protein